jgi:hypothetical protein
MTRIGTGARGLPCFRDVCQGAGAGLAYPACLISSSSAVLRRDPSQLLMLMAKSRHKKPENVRRYFKPSPEAIAELTSLLAPGDARRTRGDVVTVPGNCQ